MQFRLSTFPPVARVATRACLVPLCAWVWHSAGAQTAPAPTPAPTAQTAANPAAPVPAVAYRSVFKETSLGVEKDNEDWRKANNEVGKFLRGHVDILKWEEQENAKRAPMRKEELMQPGKAPQPAAAPAPAHKH